MEFATAAQKACYDKTASWMKELFGELVLMRDDAPTMGVMMGSALATVAVWPWGEDDATITTRAYLVTGAELAPDLMRYLLQKNADMRFGAFGVDKDGDILFEHSIVGSSCDKGELKASVFAVLVSADKYDDEIVARWGGERALDRMR